jgi:phosphoribosylaminoimidazole-succinocarboxamide synthase
MPKLSPARAEWPVLPGLKLLNRGKVRDLYELPDGKLLQVATDAISIFDFILNALVPMKGIILTAMSVFWFKMLEEYGIKHHMVAYGSAIDQYLPTCLRGNPDLQSRALVVERLDMVDDVEFIIRAVLTGSSVKPYNKDGVVCGQRLPAGLQDGDELPFLFDGPSNKAQEGHDEHVPADEIRAKYPLQIYLAIKIFQIAQRHARRCGIILADTKFEFGKNGTIADEVLTPDSSRFWPEPEWREGRKGENRKAPASFDKQIVREWGKTLGIHDSSKFDPEKPEDVDNVHAMVVPKEIIAQTTQTYRYIFWRLTSFTIEQYLHQVMHVNYPARKVPNVLLVLGSETDLPEVRKILGGDGMCSRQVPKITAHIMSCHRNPFEVMRLATGVLSNYDVIIAIGGKAFALPGTIDTWAHHAKNNIPVVGVALGEHGSRELLAAQLSIEEIPGQPVIIDELVGGAYTGPAGLSKVLDRVAYGELPPSKPRKDKPVQLGVSL